MEQETAAVRRIARAYSNIQQSLATVRVHQERGAPYTAALWAHDLANAALRLKAALLALHEEGLR